MTKVLRITSILLVMLMCIAMLASCGIGSYEKKLEKAGYDVEVADKDDIEEMNEDEDSEYKVKAYLYATKTAALDFDFVTVIKFASSSDAKDFVEEMDSKNCERKGAVVIFGTEDGVEDALGK